MLWFTNGIASGDSTEWNELIESLSLILYPSRNSTGGVLGETHKW